MFQFTIHYSNQTSQYDKFTGSTPIDWNPEKGYSDEMEFLDDFYPRPARGSSTLEITLNNLNNYYNFKGAGSTSGLTVILDAKKDDYFCSSTCSDGFKVQTNSFRKDQMTSS